MEPADFSREKLETELPLDSRDVEALRKEEVQMKMMNVNEGVNEI